MTWFRIDDSFHSHPKVLATSPAALGLWAVAGSWAGANLSDGFVPDHVLPRLLPDSTPLAKELVSTGLWKRTRGGYRFHDWHDFNPQREVIEEERKAARERMRKLREGRRTAGQSANGSGEQPANVREKFVTPTRPDPTLKGGSSSYVAHGGAREEPPPPRCPEHRTHPNPPPCRACGDARQARERWDRDQAAATAAAQSERARTQAAAARDAIHACHICDHTGYLDDGRLCTHDPNQADRVTRGAAAARAALRRTPAGEADPQ